MISRLFSGISQFASRAMTGRGVPHSVLFGVVSGVGLWAGIYGYRAIHLGLFDCGNK